MAKKDKVYMPLGTGGLIRYHEEEKPLIKIKPEYIIYIVAGIVIFEIILRFI